MTPSTVSTNSLVSVEGEGRDHRAGSDEHEETKGHRDKGDEDEERDRASRVKKVKRLSVQFSGWCPPVFGMVALRGYPLKRRNWRLSGTPLGALTAGPVHWPVHLPKTPLIMARLVIAPSVRRNWRLSGTPLGALTAGPVHCPFISRRRGKWLGPVRKPSLLTSGS